MPYNFTQMRDLEPLESQRQKVGGDRAGEGTLVLNM
jgi:hypothetical protein